MTSLESELANSTSSKPPLAASAMASERVPGSEKGRPVEVPPPLVNDPEKAASRPSPYAPAW